jgi:acyl-lipid omega-6 desaturase (Delta-12 desaturase)
MPAVASKQSDLRSAVAAFAVPIKRASFLQFVTSLGLFLLACGAMHWAYTFSYLGVMALAVPTAGLLVRLFIIQHDCGHGAYFRSVRANNIVGRVCSLFTWTPYANWRRQHAQHHGVWNNLDRRQSGADIYSSSLTVREYRALSLRRRCIYRLSRHPLVANVLLPPLIFMVLYRVPFDTPSTWKRERRSVWATNLAIMTVFSAGSLLLGVRQMVLVQVPIIIVASIIGVWLFSVQHRFAGARWDRHPSWNATAASLNSASFLRLPRVLQWFTGNIGYHHIHHLNSRVPNYRLQACHEAVFLPSAIPSMNLRVSIRALQLTLWDEERQRLATCRDVDQGSGMLTPAPALSYLQRTTCRSMLSLIGRLGRLTLRVFVQCKQAFMKR